MPVIEMNADVAEPRRLTGKLYRVTQAEGWELVSDGRASWLYVPQAKADALTSCEPEQRKEVKGALRTKRPAFSNYGEE